MTKEVAIQLIREIEIPVCRNLSQCYLNLENYHFAIKYAKQVLENEPESIKALYRLGIAFTKLGEFEKAKEKLKEALEIIDEQENPNEAEKRAIVKALHDVKNAENIQKEKEKDLSRKMITHKEKPTEQKQVAESV